MSEHKQYPPEYYYVIRYPGGACVVGPRQTLKGIVSYVKSETLKIKRKKLITAEQRDAIVKQCESVAGDLKERNAELYGAPSYRSSEYLKEWRAKKKLRLQQQSDINTDAD